jgi:NADH-quinone oxidoreductase subunit L
MTRVMLMTFFGEKRWAPSGASDGPTPEGQGTTEYVEPHPHESPATMTWPMILLAIGSVASGALFAIGGTLERWLEPVVGTHEIHHVAPAWVVTAVILTVVAVGIAIAYRMYGTKPVPAAAPAGSPLTVAARRDLYGDAFNEDVFMRPGQLLTKGLVEIDDEAVEGAATGIADLVSRTSTALRQLQTGFARSYALSMMAGAFLLIGAILAVQLW